MELTHHDIVHEAKQRLLDSILELDPETSWTRSEIEGSDGALLHLKKYFNDLLKSLVDFVEADHAYVAISSIRCAEFTPVASINRALDEIQATSTLGQQNAVSKFLWNDEIIIVISDPGRLPGYHGLPGVKEKWLIKLLGHGELVGFISLDRNIPHPEPEQVKRSLRFLIPQLTWRMAEQLFSLRLRQLAHPFNTDNQSSMPVTLYEQITERAVHGFAADGVALHLYDPLQQMLTIASVQGDVPHSLKVSQSTKKGILGAVWNDTNDGWAMGKSPNCTVIEQLGAKINEQDRKTFAADGVEAFVVMRLETEAMASQHTSLGTLSLIHNRRHAYSWRDIALLRSFCARVADTLGLQQQTEMLKERAEALEKQSKMLTRVEVVALLAHDLMHRSFAACQAVDKYISAVNSSFRRTRERKDNEPLDELEQRASQLTLNVHNSMAQLRTLYRATDTDAPPTTFDVNDVVETVRKTLAGALDHHKITVKRQVVKPMQLIGQETVLEQVLFNLFINAIDSLKGIKNGLISIHGRIEEQGSTRTAILQIEDNGPGIDPRFANAQDIFKIGTTTKKTGTGTGLPAARSLLGTHFSGNLVLKRARPVLFEIAIPQTGTFGLRGGNRA